VHGTSGVTLEDQSCRVEQFEQVFVDIRDGTGLPAANGARNVVLGDLNTDPGRLAALDPSAHTWNRYVGDGQPFIQISDTGPLAEPTYANLLNIDHVASDAFDGDCFAGMPTNHRLRPPADCLRPESELSGACACGCALAARPHPPASRAGIAAVALDDGVRAAVGAWFPG